MGIMLINGERVERVSSIHYLGVYIAEDLTWATHTTAHVKKAQKAVVFLADTEKGRSATRIAGNLLLLLHREHHHILHTALYMVSQSHCSG